MPYYASSQSGSDAGDNRYHITFLSRYPLRDIYTFSDTSSGLAALSMVIDSPLGEMSLCNVHLPAHLEEERAGLLKEVLRYQSQYPSHVILADLNAISRADQYGDLSAKEFTYHGLTGFETTDMMKEGYIDSVAHLDVQNRRTHPTAGVPHVITETPVRIDYIFVTKSLSERLKSAEVIKTPISDNASDHYPVTLTLGNTS